MSRRIEPDLERASTTLAAIVANPAMLAPDAELETPALPRDLPPWARDAVAISQRARALLARVKPIVVSILTFWDHRARSAFVAGKRLSIDVSGSYRLE